MQVLIHLNEREFVTHNLKHHYTPYDRSNNLPNWGNYSARRKWDADKRRFSQIELIQSAFTPALAGGARVGANLRPAYPA